MTNWLNVLSLLFFLQCQLCNAQSQEDFSKALFILDIAEHTKLPETAITEYTVTVIGDSKVYRELLTHLQGRHIYGLPIKYRQTENAEEAIPSGIVFLSLNRSGQLIHALKKIKDKPVIIISEEPGAYNTGADFSFVKIDGKLKVDVNQETLKRKNIKLSRALTEIVNRNSAMVTSKK